MDSGDELNTDYMSYMLRMWRKRDSNGNQVWCASLQEPWSRHTENFGDVSDMFSFLQGRLGVEGEGMGENMENGAQT